MSFLTLLLALPACDRPVGESAPSAGSDTPAVRVQAARPERGEAVRRIRLPGTVRGEQEVRLHAKASGFVKSIVKDRGDRAAAGEVVATLDIPELALDQRGARAGFDLEDATLRRLEAIRAVEKSAVTDQDLDVARSKRAVAEAALKRVETLLAYSEVRAPFDGVVTERFVDVGALVQQGPVAALVDLSKVRILLDVPEAEARFVRSGTTAQVRLDAVPGRTFDAAVARTASALDAATRTLRAELEASNPDGALLPGMYAVAELELERRAGALLVPSRAVLVEQGKPVLYVHAGGRLKKVAITTGIDDGRKTEVAAGLTGDEAVVLPGGQALTDGMAVILEEQKKP